MSLHTAVRPRRYLIPFAAALVAAAVAGPVAGPASAKGGEGGSGTERGAGTVSFIDPAFISPPLPCQVKSFSTDSVIGLGDTGLSAITADYQVRPCDSKSSVTLEVLVFEKLDPTNVVVDRANAPLSGGISVVAPIGVSYTVELIIRDGVSGAVVGTASKTASIPVPTGA